MKTIVVSMLVVLGIIHIHMITGVPQQSGSGAPAIQDRKKDCLTEEGKKCKFPFTFEGTEYKGCTKAGKAGKEGRWCRTMDGGSDYCTTDGSCPIAVCKTDARQEDKAGKGKCTTCKCKFPFTHDGKKYYGCTTAVTPKGTNSERRWCKTRYEQWGYCDPPALDGGTEQTFNDNCPSDWPDCSTKAKGGKCQNCRCIFPFKSGVLTYDGCTKANSPGGRWCRTMDMRWGYCPDKETEKCPMHVFRKRKRTKG